LSRETAFSSIVNTVHFESTCWTDIAASCQGDSEQAQAALNRLCRRYWTPIYFFLRRSGVNAADAEDYTQEFLAELLRHDAFAKVHPSRGRFRTFLIASLKNFMGHALAKAKAQKRGGGLAHLDLNDTVEALYHRDCEDHGSPEHLFERQWVWTVLDHVHERLAGEYAACGKVEYFEHLSAYLPGRLDPRPQVEVAAALGLSVSAIRSEVYRMRQRFGQYLRAEIASTVSSPAEIDEEIQHLLTVLGS
jgi:RNA polymerase sigma-70 factor (ECF subfamily)